MAVEAPDSRKQRILIVEDDRISSSDLKSTLGRLGYEVTGVAETGEEAVSLAADNRPDLALVDIRLRGEIDGIAAAGILNEKWGVPVVFLTGYSGDEVFSRARSARPAGYLRKPFSDGELTACLEAAVGRSVARSVPKSPALSEPDPDPEPKPETSETRPDPALRAPALARARELSQRESFRELLGFRNENGAESKADGEGDDEAFGVEPDEAAGASPSLIDEIADPLLVLDEGWRITQANAEALAYFGGKHPLIGRDFWEGFAPLARERYLEEFQRPLVDGKRHTFEFHDGERDRWLEANVYRSSGGLLALFRDVSVRKQVEAENVRVQRLEGLGLLARGFAHDFNNLLTVLIGNLDFARERFPNDAEFQEEMRDAETAANHARNLVLQLLTFAQGGRPVREPTRVAELLRHILEERRRERPNIRYQFQCADPNLRVNVDRGQIRRLVQNLVTNAEQAMADQGGTLIARCAIASGEEVGRWNGKPFPAEEEHLVLEIIDTGRGMSEVELERAFEPYFTTRPDANATGIGLTVCESIAKAHDGFVLLQSKLGRGTIATFCMPLGAPSWADASAEPSASFVRPFVTGRDAEVPAMSARILVLEDDHQIRKLIAMTLRKDGHEVVETADGRDTIRCFQEAGESGRPFDLVVSDLTIEDGLGGVETMQALRRLDPDVVAIVSSGYSDAPAMARPADFGFTAVLPKPYPPKDLRRIVSRVLSSRRVRHWRT